jgi:zinc and cadmium transporter
MWVHPIVAAWIPAIVSVLIVSAISLVGALTLTLSFLRKHMVLLLLVSFAVGTLLGDAFIHVLPHAVEEAGGFTHEIAALVLGGFIAFFVLETGLRWGHGHGEREHPHAMDEEMAVAPYAWTNLVGDGMHNFVDGALIAASYLVSFPVGVATTVAVVAHEIPQELGDFAVLLKAGLKLRTALFYNLMSAVVALVGALVVLLAGLESETVADIALPITAGGFIYIAAADLIPELHHHSKPKYVPIILAGLVLGLGTMWALLALE